MYIVQSRIRITWLQLVDREEGRWEMGDGDRDGDGGKREIEEGRYNAPI
jgi:hypothetical protein